MICLHCRTNWLYSSQEKAMGACSDATCVAAARAIRLSGKAKEPKEYDKELLLGFPPIYDHDRGPKELPIGIPSGIDPELDALLGGGDYAAACDYAAGYPRERAAFLSRLARKNAAALFPERLKVVSAFTFQFSPDRRNVGVDVPPLSEALLLEQPQRTFRPHRILLSPGAGCEKHEECLKDWERAERCVGADRMPIGSVGKPRRRLRWFTVMGIRIGKDEQLNSGPLPADRFAWMHSVSPIQYDTCYVSQIFAVKIRNDDPKQMHRILAHAVGVGVQ